MIIRTSIPRIVSASAIAVWPFVLVLPEIGPVSLIRLMRHERKHLEQQRRWFVYGLGVGLLAWYFLYLCCLPVGVNPWRQKWEDEALRAEGYTGDDEIRRMLKGPPWRLWWV